MLDGADTTVTQVWMLREYNEIDPIILSVGEAEEVSIKQVADSIVKAMRFEGEYQVGNTQSSRSPSSD